ncbi:MAG: hypothetical protein ONB13_04330 [candidate division KSB1 bacterium]|nr:hypothetical protein [candidate division KSB1 bacterium]
MKQIIVLFLLGTCGQAFAGKYAAEFLRIGVGARALGLAGAYVAMADDGSASYWNPAGLTDLNKHQLLFSHAQMFQNLADHHFANCSIRLGSATALAASWIRLAVDDIPRYSELIGTRYDRFIDPNLRSTGTPEGYFGDVEDAVILSFARAFDFDLIIGTGLNPAIIPLRLGLGVSYKFISQKLDRFEGKGQGIDLGLKLSLIGFEGENDIQQRCLSFGFSIQDLAGTPVVWNTGQRSKDQLPINLMIGVAYAERIPFVSSRLTISLERDDSYQSFNRLGAELTFNDMVALRAGLENDRWTAGAGFRLYFLRLDYAFLNSELGNSHRISGAVEF